MEQESTNQNYIDALLLLLSKRKTNGCYFDQRYHAALTALVAERDALRERVAELEAEPSSELSFCERRDRAWAEELRKPAPADRDRELRERVAELERDVDMWREDAHKWEKMYNSHYESERIAISRVVELETERDALKQRIAQMESQEFTLPSDPFRDPNSDLRKHLICAVLTGLNSNPELITHAEHFPKFAVNQANAVIVLILKGDA